MNETESFLVLGIEITKDERAIKNAYRERLTVTNPEDNPEGFKRLRSAYETACRYAKESGENRQEKPRDTTPSGGWLERAVEIYGNIRTRQDVACWKALFEEDIFFSIEEEENCRLKLLGYLTEHFKLPTAVWKLFDQKLSIVSGAKELREKFPLNFVHYIVGRCERGEDLEFDQFEGPDDGEYDLFLEYYDRCWQALQEKNLEEAVNCVKSADALGIRHPVMEISRANILARQGRREEAVLLMDAEREKYPEDTMICYNYAELLWMMGEEDTREGTAYRQRSADFYEELKAGNDTHYMANLRLTEWYYGQQQYRKAKKCAEKVLASGSDDAFLDLLGRINEEIEKELYVKCQEDSGWEPWLELCWCYLQDGKIAQGIQLAGILKKMLPPEKDAEYKGLLAKLYVEQGDYEESIVMTGQWEAALEEKMKKCPEEEEKEKKKDRDRMRQAHLIRVQCYHNLGFRDREKFPLAIQEAESILSGSVKDVGILLEMAQIYAEMEEYEQCQEVTRKLVEEYQIFAGYASSMEAYRRQLNAGGVVRTASQCLRYFPNFAKAYEYLAKVYLDLDRREDLEKVLEDAEKNGVQSPILEAYAFQKDHEVMDINTLNARLKGFRDLFFKQVENGDSSFYEKGLPILTEYLYHYPDDFMLVERAIFHRAAHCLEESKADFEKALYLNPVNPYALNGLSLVYKYQGDYERALFFLKKAILYMDEEMSPVIYTDMGNLYSLLGIYEKALDAYKQYETLGGENRSNWFGDNQADFHARMGNLEEAEAVCTQFYQKDRWNRYRRQVELCIAAGDGEKACRTQAEWGRELYRSSVKRIMKGILSPGVRRKAEVISYPDYYCSRGWVELVFGKRSAALRAFDRMFRNGLTESSMEGKICDAVFACILCEDAKRGQKYAQKLQDWLSKEKAAGRTKYYNREKAHLQIEFLAAYYTESIEKLQEILDRGENCEICHFCNCPLCKELESAGILLLLRMGKQEEAKKLLRHSLEIQPWDEYLLAVKHTVFEDKL